MYYYLFIVSDKKKTAYVYKINYKVQSKISNVFN